MAWIVRVVVGVLVIAHGLVHLLYLASDVPEFSLDRSLFVPEGARRPLAMVLMAGCVIGFGLLGLALMGVPGLQPIWPALTVVSVALSMLLMVAFWNNRLVLGVTIDLVMLAAALIRPTWIESVTA